MSVSADEKGGPYGNTAAPARWLIPKLLSSALILAFLLIIFLDASVISFGDQPPNSLHIHTYLSPNNTSATFQSQQNLSATTTTTTSSSSSSYSSESMAISILTNAASTESFSASPPPPPPPPQNEAAGGGPIAPSWISVAMPKNLTSTLLSRWRTPGGEPCRDALTCAISIPGLDGISQLITLAAGDVHTFSISALDEMGNRRCLGGDYFETHLSGESWKSRPPITDHGNGSYSFSLQLHPHFAGNYTLTIVLLFRSFQGLKLSPQRFKFRRELRKIPISFVRNPNMMSLPDLKICGSWDFLSELCWSGRWTRHAKNDQCRIDNAGRYRCLDPNFQCQTPWCDGPLGSLESNGWVYSAGCSFRIFTSDSAWKCLSNKWLFFWGDSNHVDTIRNLLNFVLGLTDIASVPRRFDMRFANPRNKSESVRITSIFNGHWNDTNNYLGLESLKNEYFRQLLWHYFSEDGAPDVMIFNSGLHDGVYWRSIRAFADGAEYAAKFWEEILLHLKNKGLAIPRIFYRTTIATGGYARDLAFNPNKMEAFNGVLLEKLKEKGLITGGVIDEFDMTFPWHYDNRCNDGVHYGRAPAKAKWRDGEIGHQYFVDLMLVHVLLNAICND